MTPFDHQRELFENEVARLEREITVHKTGFIIAALVAIVAVVTFFVWQAHADDRHEAQLKVLHDTMKADSIVRVAQVQMTDSLTHVADSLAHRALTVSTIYRTKSDTFVKVIDNIVDRPVPDSVKIKELVREALNFKFKADSNDKVCRDALSACDKLKIQYAQERVSWDKELTDTKHALKISESLHRHWGLGGTCGLAVVGYGRPGVGVGCAVGLTYRR